MISAPCKDCAERQIGCHSSCEKYQNFCRENEARREAERQAKILDYDEAFIKRMRRLRDRMRRR